MRRYSKAIAQVVATVLVALTAVLAGDNVISPSEWVNVAIAGAGALAVFTAPNVPGAPYTKSILAAVSAGLAVLSSTILGGLSTTEIFQIAVAALGAVGVYAVENK